MCATHVIVRHRMRDTLQVQVQVHDIQSKVDHLLSRMKEAGKLLNGSDRTEY